MIVVRFGSSSRRCISLKTPLLDSRVIGILLLLVHFIANELPLVSLVINVESVTQELFCLVSLILQLLGINGLQLLLREPEVLALTALAVHVDLEPILSCRSPATVTD